MKVLGRMLRDPFCEALDLDYQHFESPTGLIGLAKPDGDRLDLLAVISAKKGSFRAFIEQAKTEFRRIYVWEVWNPVLTYALGRYGFVETVSVDDGERLKGFVWEASK